jgi:hypothetical protein
MVRQAQPRSCRQHDGVTPAVLTRIAVAVSTGQYVPQFRAPSRAAAKRIQGQIRIRERGDLEAAQYRLPVLTTQAPDLGNGGTQFHCRDPAVQASCHEQVVHPLPGFRQRGHDALQPIPERRRPPRRVLHSGNVGGPHRFPGDVIDPGGQPGHETRLGGDAEEPAAQAVRTRQLRGVSHRQAGGNENVAGRGDRRIRVGP